MFIFSNKSKYLDVFGDLGSLSYCDIFIYGDKFRKFFYFSLSDSIDKSLLNVWLNISLLLKLIKTGLFWGIFYYYYD